MGYLLLYIYRIRQEDREEFLEVMRKARWIYRGHGGAGEELSLLDNDTPYHSLTGIWEVTPPAHGEEVWIGLDRYEDADQCREVMRAVDEDPDIDPLYERVVQLVGSADRIVRGEFRQMDY
jgi:uncharacterized protein YbaA (DUF1428 family)